MKLKILGTALLMIMLSACGKQMVSTMVGGTYDKHKDETSYFVLPYGSTSIPGKWSRAEYNKVSHQQFFKNTDGIDLAIAFGEIDQYEFNKDRSKTGFHFVQAYYDWESAYFRNTYNLQTEIIESNESQHFIIWRIYGNYGQADFDTYFLLGEQAGKSRNFSITKTEKWSAETKIALLKQVFTNTK